MPLAHMPPLALRPCLPGRRQRLGYRLQRLCQASRLAACAAGLVVGQQGLDARG